MTRLMIAGLIAAACAFGAQAETITYNETQTVSTPLAVSEATTIDVAEGVTVTFDAAAVITGGSPITKTGKGKLVIASANDGFTGGFVIEQGYLVAAVGMALGTAAVEIRGQTPGYTGPCGLGLWGDATSLKAVGPTYANAIHVTGNTTVDYPALIVYGVNATLTGKITAEQDFIFFDDYPSVSAIYSTQSDRYKNATSLTFGEIDVKGTLGAEGWTKFICAGKIKAAVLDLTVERKKGTEFTTTDCYNNANAHLALELLCANEIGRIITNKHPFYCKTKNALGGAIMEWRVYNGYKYGNQLTTGWYSFGGNAQTVAGFESTLFDLQYANLAQDGSVDKGIDWYFNYGANNTVVTVKGVPPDEGESTKELVTCNRLGYWSSSDALSVVLDSDYAGFTQTFSNRLHSMGGAITVSNGTWKVAGTATFSNATAVVVGPNGVFRDESTNPKSLMSVKNLTIAGKFIVAPSATEALPTSLATLSLYDGATVQVPGLDSLTVTELYLNGCPVGAGTWTHANHSAIPDGLTVTATGGSWPAASATETWVGGQDDLSMSNLGNWQGPPESVDLASGATDVKIASGAGMTYSGTAWVDGIENLVPWTNSEGVVAQPFVIAPAAEGDKLVITRKLASDDDRQMVLRGHIATPYGIDQGPGNTSTGVIEYRAPTYDASLQDAVTAAGIVNGYGRSVPLVLDDAVVDKPLYLRTRSIEIASLVSKPGTTNVVNGNVHGPAGSQNYISALADSLITFTGGINYLTSLRWSGPGEIRIVDRPYTNSAYSYLRDNVKLVLDAPDCSVGGNENGEGFGLTAATIEFRRSGCTTDSMPIFFDNATGVNGVDLNATTQRVGRAGFVTSSTRAYLRGIYPAMLELTGKERTGATYLTAKASAKADKANVPITGGVGIHVCGDYAFQLYGRAFASCGDLEASAGTLELAAGASWLNGTNFTARGTGTLKFAGSRQVSGSAVLRLADEGKVELADGKILRVAECWVDGTKIDDGIYTYATAPDALKAHLVESTGTLRVGKVGLMWILR